MSIADQFKPADTVAPAKSAPAVAKEVSALPAMVKAAADKLASATTAAQVLDAKDAAGLVYDASKRAARVAKAKKAHDQVIAAAHRAQADALDIEAAAKRRLADEYDAAQPAKARKGGRPKTVPDENGFTAAEAGVSRKEVHDARQLRDAIAANPEIVREALDDILAKGDEPTRTALRKAIAPATKAVRAHEQTAKKDRRAEREIELAAEITALPGERYGVIVADPEWRFEPYSRETGMDRAADNHYPTSALEEIKARDVQSIAADDCVLFLWATAPMLPQALEVMAAWGFAYKTHAIWFKQRAGDGRGTGYWFLGEHEVLLVGTRGDVVAPAMGTQARSVFEAPAGRHSEKPEIALEIIERYFPNLPKIELNRRGPARPGWSAWGNEVSPATSDGGSHEVDQHPNAFSIAGAPSQTAPAPSAGANDAAAGKAIPEIGSRAETHNSHHVGRVTDAQRQGAVAAQASEPHPQEPTSSPVTADKGEADTSSHPASPAPFTNPRCKKPDICKWAHSMASCSACNDAWARARVAA